jgi:glycosyltransferase involved in cell wall biosynthesis
LLHPGALSQKKWKKKHFLQAFKLLEYHHKVLFHATDEEEKKFIINQFGKPATILIAGNYPTFLGASVKMKKEKGFLKLVSIAILNPMKNILLVLQALQNVEETVQYDIYGPVKDESYRDECLLQIKALPKNVSVFIHKEIEPHEVKEVLSKADVFILPSKSENFGHAMFEALSAGLPLITSHHTPWINLEKSHAGINVDVEKTEEISLAIQGFARMPEEEFQQWRAQALQYAAAAIDKEVLREKYEAMFFG